MARFYSEEEVQEMIDKALIKERAEQAGHYSLVDFLNWTYVHDYDIHIFPHASRYSNGEWHVYINKKINAVQEKFECSIDFAYPEEIAARIDILKTKIEDFFDPANVKARRLEALKKSLEDYDA